jgi:RNA polymerase sigma factor (sigma-70 family)
MAAAAPALAGLTDQDRNKLVSFARRLVDPDRAEDLVQDALLCAWRARDQFRGDSTLQTYLCACVRNSARSWHRSKAHRQEAAEIPLPDFARLDRYLPYKVPEHQSRSFAAQLLRACAIPPESERCATANEVLAWLADGGVGTKRYTVIIRLLAEGADYNEIARRTGLTVQCVKTRFVRLRAACAKLR